nr:MAG TPA: hypothetical protein [Bacteriophage sp.]
MNDIRIFVYTALILAGNYHLLYCQLLLIATIGGGCF